MLPAGTELDGSADRDTRAGSRVRPRSDGAMAAIGPSTPLTNRGELSVDSVLASSTASSTATAVGHVG